MYSVYQHNRNYQQEVLRYWKDQYRKPGLNPGFEEFAKHYTVKMGQRTDWYGYAHHGKSELMFEVCINLAEQFGIKTAVRAPDVGLSKEILVDLAARYLKDPNPPEDQKYRAIEWIQEHFLILDAPKDKDGIPTEGELTDFCKFLRTQDVQMGVIDSFNHLPLNLNDHGGRQDFAFRKSLNAANQMMHDSQQHLHCVWHLSGEAKMRKDGTFPEPHHNLISGGREVGNFGRALIGVHRPDPLTNITEVRVSKAKPKGIGVIGSFELRYDVATGRYYEITEYGDREGHYMHYAYEKAKNAKTPYEPTQITPNTDFDDEPF